MEGRHYSYEELEAAAKENGGSTTITLNPGDTAYAPGTTKYWLAGDGGTVTYFFYPEAVEGETSGKVWRTER